MEKIKDKYAPSIVRDLSGIFALKDANDPAYLSGPKLVDLFNGLGFPDTYTFSGGGIKTPDAVGLSRTAYALKRLTDLNESLRLNDALSALIQSSNAVKKITGDINTIFKQYNIQSPLTDLNQRLGKGTEKISTPIARPVVSDSNIDLNYSEIPVQNFIQDEVFDVIPPGYKIAFISYSWDDDAHKEWVLKLSNALIKLGIYTLLDQYNPSGYSLTHFMDKGIDVADKVIVVGSPKYLEKSRKMASSGVQYEDNIISSELMTNVASTKFIPVIHGGKFDECLPAKLSKRLGFDFGDDTQFNQKVGELARAIYNVPNCPRPVLGPPPTFTYDDLTEAEKEDLKSPNSDFRKSQDRKWLDRLLGSFSFDLMNVYLNEYPTFIDDRILTSIDSWNRIMAYPTFRIYDPELLRILNEFHRLWQKATEIGLNYYSTTQTKHRLKFNGLEHDEFTSSTAQKDYDKLIEIHLQMQPLLKELATYILDNFEIDVEQTSHEYVESLDRNGL